MTTLFGHEVRDLQPAVRRQLDAARSPTGAPATKRKINAKFVFVGAGGGALPLLQKSGIKEAKGFGGFPVGGAVPAHRQPELAAAHQAKVYGLPPLGAPPMSVPHLDTRVINGQVLAVVRPVRRLVAEVPEAGQGHRPAVLGQAEQPGARCSASGVTETEPGQVPGRPAAAQRSRPGSTRCANSRPAQSIPTGNSTSRASGSR